MSAAPRGNGEGDRPTQVLLAEDEESFIDALVVGLEREGFAVTIARDGADALATFRDGSFDLVLLDVMLPKMSGLDVCRAIRAQSGVPIIMVTAKSTEIDTVVGLEVGADDYVAKPYRLRELVSRMRAVMRRTPAPAPAAVASAAAVAEEAPRAALAERVLEIGDIRLDLDRHECMVRGAEVSLPLKEFELLTQLLNNAGRVVTREVLIDRVWGFDYVGDTKTLDVHIKRLRSRIELDPSKPQMITTIRGLGYRLEDPARH
ncbi:MAG TPA: response regulator transcription factor [Acidimicrobiales bacterium]|nr:response regulator transcription factor [Acidimicrobiales bacterium]